MKIVVQFNSLEEFKQFFSDAPKIAPESNEKPKAKKSPKKAEKPQSEEKTEVVEAPEKEEPEAAAEAPAPAEISEDEAQKLRLETRKILAELNKVAQKNLANGMIKKYGVEKLTQVAANDLPALRQEAEAALMGYEKEDDNA